MRRTIVLTSLATVILLMSGCVRTTAIKNLVLPPVTAIEGTINRLDERGFTLTDDSGSIFVRATLPDPKSLSLNERVRVFGNLQGGQERVFDGYVIRKSTGEQIMVSKPSPHFGFIIQSAFK